LFNYKTSHPIDKPNKYTYLVLTIIIKLPKTTYTLIQEHILVPHVHFAEPKAGPNQILIPYSQDHKDLFLHIGFRYEAKPFALFSNDYIQKKKKKKRSDLISLSILIR
jgi:hypothetical protein